MKLSELPAFEVGKQFINKRNERITIESRVLTANDVVEYTVKCGLKTASVNHETIENGLKNGEWKEL